MKEIQFNMSNFQSQNIISKNWNYSIKAFLDAKKIKNLSETTIKWYEYVINDFRTAINSPPPYGVSKEHVNKYILHLKEEREYKATSINTNLKALRAFFNFLTQEGILDGQISITLLRAKKTIIRTFSDKQAFKLAKRPNIKEASFAEFRDWAICCFLLATGVRLRSLINIRVSDIDFESNHIYLTHTKNRQEQALPLSKSLKGVLKEYLSVREGEGYDYLFCNVYGDQLTSRTCQRRIKKYCKERLGSTKDIRCSPHDFRHYFAKAALKGGTDIFTLQRLLGHKSLDMVKRYLNLFVEDIEGFISPLDLALGGPLKGKKQIKMPHN